MQTQLKIVPLKNYLSKLEKQLQILPRDEREDILKELESQFYESSQQGEHPEEILERLGKPNEYARPFLNDYLEEIQVQGSFNQHLRLIWKKSLLPEMVLLLGWIALMMGNTLYLFDNTIEKYQAGFWQVCQLLLGSLPAILVVSLPFVVLWVVPLYLFSLRSQEPRQVLKRPKVYLVVLLIGLACTLLSHLVQDFVVPASNRYTVEMFKDMMQAARQAECTENCETQPKLVFSSTPDIRSMSAGEAKKFIEDEPRAPTHNIDPLLKDYYLKFSLPLANLVCAVFGLMTASLMLSGMFHPYYTLIVIGTIFPLGLWYKIYASAELDQLGPLLAAHLPNLALLAVALIFLIGLVLPGAHQRTDSV